MTHGGTEYELEMEYANYLAEQSDCAEQTDAEDYHRGIWQTLQQKKWRLFLF